MDPYVRPGGVDVPTCKTRWVWWSYTYRFERKHNGRLVFKSQSKWALNYRLECNIAMGIGSRCEEHAMGLRSRGGEYGTLLAGSALGVWCADPELDQAARKKRHALSDGVNPLIVCARNCWVA